MVYTTMKRIFNLNRRATTLDWVVFGLSLILFSLVAILSIRSDYLENRLTKCLEESASSTAQILPNKSFHEVSRGIASWYDYGLSHSLCQEYGGPILEVCLDWANNWSKEHDTAASRSLPRYSYARITNLDNGKSVRVFINDYGPQSCEDRIKNGFDDHDSCQEREIDLSSHAFSQIADPILGLVKVKIEQEE